jgi:hypothetical protein
VRNKVDLAKVRKLAAAGLTKEQLAVVFEKSVRTITNWMNDGEFLSSLKKGNKKANENVIASLYARACGFEFTEVTKERKKGVLVVTKVVTKHLAPDPVAAIFWLTNRDGEHWKHRSEIDHTSKGEKLERPVFISPGFAEGSAPVGVVAPVGGDGAGGEQSAG